MIEVDGHLTVEQAEEVLSGQKVGLSPKTRAKVEASHSALLSLLERGTPIYGVNTGFGALSKTIVPQGKLGDLQRNLVRSHACGVGKPVPDEIVRLTLLFRLNSLIQGASGVRPALVELLMEMLNREVYPVVPEQGSVGASGDLVPLAHVALVLIGEGRARYQGQEMPGAEALRRARLSPLPDLAPKEGLALLNGTSFMLALLFLGWLWGKRAFAAALHVAALTFQALGGSTEPLDPRLHALRPHPGQIEVAGKLRELLQGSKLLGRTKNDVQDPYSLRCLPQILGPVAETLRHVRRTLEIEMNSVTDNPLILPEGAALTGGNFHGQVLALAAEELGIALATLGNSCERRLALLLECRDLPPFLAKEPGKNSGLMLLHYTAAALCAENKVLSHPSAVDTIPTSAGKEDHNSMGATAAWKAWRIAENVVHQVALEAVAARWALALLGEEKISPATRSFYEELALVIPPPGEDQSLSENIARLAQEIRKGGSKIHEV